MKKMSKTDKKINTMDTMNRVLMVIFSIMSVAGFGGMVSEPYDTPDFWKPLVFFFALFLVSITLAWYFHNPKHARRTMFIKLCKFIKWLRFTKSELRYKRMFKKYIHDVICCRSTWKSLYLNYINRNGNRLCHMCGKGEIGVILSECNNVHQCNNCDYVRIVKNNG